MRKAGVVPSMFCKCVSFCTLLCHWAYCTWTGQTPYKKCGITERKDTVVAGTQSPIYTIAEVFSALRFAVVNIVFSHTKNEKHAHDSEMGTSEVLRKGVFRGYHNYLIVKT